MTSAASTASGKIGLEWLAKIKELRPNTQVVIITAHGEVEIVVNAMKIGAADFIEKPWRNEKLLATVQATIDAARRKSVGSKPPIPDQPAKIADFVGESAAMREVFKTIDKVANTDANVLITGENGTGKELAARELHRKSGRASRPLVQVDLGTISEGLFESELFGHKKGAFTDAFEDRIHHLLRNLF